METVKTVCLTRRNEGSSLLAHFLEESFQPFLNYENSSQNYHNYVANRKNGYFDIYIYFSVEISVQKKKKDLHHDGDGRTSYVRNPTKLHRLTFILPVPSRRFASEAALCDSYSRKQNPRFFFLSSGEL